MKLSAALSAVLISSSCCAALEKRQSAGTCSLGIARLIGRTSWDVTIYNVPQAYRQDTNVIAAQTNNQAGLGDSFTVNGPPDITITNVNNAPVFDYDIPLLQAPLNDPANGVTKVELKFEIPAQNLTFTTADCGAGNTIWSAGIESWSCDFECEVAVNTREL